MREFRIRDHHEANKIRPYWCPGPLNVADFFSKTLQKNLFNINLKRLGMVGSFRDEVESRALHNDPPPCHLGHIYGSRPNFGCSEAPQGLVS